MSVAPTEAQDDDDTAALSLREKRHRHVVVAVERAALELFYERGYETVTIAEIAEAAGVSVRTLFRYFATKDEIVMASEVATQRRLVRFLRDQPGNIDVFVALRQALVASAAVPASQRPAVLKRWRVMIDTPLLRTRARVGSHEGEGELIAELAHRMGLPVGDPRPKVLAVSTIAVAAAAFEAWATNDGVGEPEEWMARYLGIFQAVVAKADTSS